MIVLLIVLSGMTINSVIASGDSDEKWNYLRKYTSKKELYGKSPSTLQAITALEQLKSDHVTLFGTLQEKGDVIFQEISPKDASKKSWETLKFQFSVSLSDLQKEFKKAVVTYHGTSLSNQLTTLKEITDKNLKLIENNMQTLIQAMTRSYLTTTLKQLRGQVYYVLDSGHKDIDIDLIEPTIENPFPTKAELLLMKKVEKERIRVFGTRIYKTAADSRFLTN